MHAGTLRTAAQNLDRIAAMGFDVLYLTPVSPIGTTNRKGRNNTLVAQKAFGKMPKDYLRTQSAQELINALSVRLKCLTADLVKVVQGGDIQGTWLHEDIALDFAQWLSVN